jgi:ABC-2 type transport system ATP-binding protein
MIEVKGVSKWFVFRRRALDSIQLTVDRGDMFGLIGPNGAGKTTLIRILATVLKPSEGMAYIDGLAVTRDAEEIRRVIGYMPDHFGVYEELDVQEYLDFFACAFGMRGPRRASAVEGVLELVDLTQKRKALIGSLSRGMQQRVGLARILIHDPKVLILDEPASGLDPRARIEVRALLKELRKMGKTVLISSHILADLADLCNKIALIEKGKVLYAGGIDEAMKQVKPEDVWYVGVFDGLDRARGILEKQPFVESVTESDGQLCVKIRNGQQDIHDVPRLLMEGGVRLKSFRAKDVTLEEAFLKLTQGEVS